MPFPTELVNLALLGTDQVENVQADPALEAVLTKRGDLGKEVQLLLTSAGIALRDLAGYIPPKMTRETPETCPSDEMAVVNPAALRHLMVMLEGHHEEVMPEWLKTVTEAGKRIPEEALPLLLELGRKQTSLRDLIAPIIGERGRWLALEATPKDWGWIAPRNPEKTWQEGAPDKRYEVLEALRKSDPAKGRELLQSTWAEEKSQQRERFIFALWHGIGADDEPFLENVLDDGAQDVRRKAREMLATIPESRFYARMVARAESFVKLKKRDKFEFAFPAELDAAMERDGMTIDPGLPDDQIPRSLLSQILEAMRPEWWRNHFGLTNAELVEVFDKTKTPMSLVLLLLKGAYRANDTETIEFLLFNQMKKLKGENVSLVPSFGLLSPESAERVLMNMIHKPETWNDTPANLMQAGALSTIVEAGKFHWSRALTEVFLLRLRAYLEGGKTRPLPPTRSMLTHLSLYFPPAMTDQIMAVVDVSTDIEKAWGDLVDNLRFTLEFRREMLAAIHS